MSGINPGTAAGRILNGEFGRFVTFVQRLAVKATTNPLPALVAEFLSARWLAVAAVSRAADQPANAVSRRLRDLGREVVAINPRANRPQRAGTAASVSINRGSVLVSLSLQPAVARQCRCNCARGSATASSRCARRRPATRPCA